MSERHITHPEHHEQPRNQEISQEHEARLEQAIEHGKQARHEYAGRVPELMNEAQEEARSSEEIVIEQKEQRAEQHTMRIDRSVKEAARRRVLKRVRKHLRPDERVFSKVTHNPGVDAVSRVAEKTVARPSGLFGGGLLALIGSSAYLLIARHYGYEYNYLLFLFLFFGGMLVGLSLELLLRIVRKKQT